MVERDDIWFDGREPGDSFQQISLGEIGPVLPLFKHVEHAPIGDENGREVNQCSSRCRRLTDLIAERDSALERSDRVEQTGSFARPCPQHQCNSVLHHGFQAGVAQPDRGKPDMLEDSEDAGVRPRPIGDSGSAVHSQEEIAGATVACGYADHGAVELLQLPNIAIMLGLLRLRPEEHTERAANAFRTYGLLKKSSGWPVLHNCADGVKVWMQR